MTFPRLRLAVFVDGCFWHACPEHGTVPKANAEYWVAKLEANVIRDRRNDAELACAGWSVTRLWEHQDPREMADSICLIAASLERLRAPVQHR